MRISTCPHSKHDETETYRQLRTLIHGDYKRVHSNKIQDINSEVLTVLEFLPKGTIHPALEPKRCCCKGWYAYIYYPKTSITSQSPSESINLLIFLISRSKARGGMVGNENEILHRFVLSIEEKNVRRVIEIIIIVIVL